MESREYQDLLEKYKSRVAQEFGSTAPANSKFSTKEYTEFKEELYPGHYSLYEKACNFADNLFKLSVDQQKAEAIQKNLDVCNLNVRPSGVIALSFLLPLATIVIGSLITFGIFGMFFFLVFFLITGLLMIPALQKVPDFMANTWRMKASNQMVQSVFYIVTYMRHTSNLERAIEFAADHLEPPLSLDFRKILWDVETEKYSTIRASAEAYLLVWKEWDSDFIESFHLIESSLFESSEERRLALLDKALDVILTGTYETMLHYAHSLKSPITMLHMLGIILPILGLVILPLVVSFMDEVKWFHLAFIYDISLPIAVYYMGKNILSKRPTGYGDTDISEENPELKKYRNILLRIGKSEIKIDPMWAGIIIFSVFLFLGLIPVMLHLINPDFELSFFNGQFQLLGYRLDKAGEKIIGPYGLGASILSMGITLSLGLGIGTYFRLKSKNVIKIREKSKMLEQEFASALFQLGNKLGDGIPAETAVGKVAETMEGTVSGNFFKLVSMNVRKLGMGVQRAIFDPKYGALVYFPSNLIESSMKVLIESIKKGPLIAAQALMNVSRYIKEIHKVNERLKDLMADIISSMTSQIKFLTPVISGIVIGITSMIMTILVQLTVKLGEISESGIAGPQSGVFTQFGDGIRTYFFQIIIGIYVVQIIYILTILSNGIQNGSDKLSERYNLGVNLTRSTILYVVVSLIVMIIFNVIATQILVTTVPSA